MLDGAPAVRPDPRSRRQPRGVHELSAWFDPAAHMWQDADWTGRQLAGSVVYELHIGTFTPDGTLDSAIARLDHLVDLGIGFVELLPVNAFNGTHNWGYDGVLWYAVHEGYGGPAAYQRFVDACHRRGLGVIQDVVHNHLGPSGNYLPEFGPYLRDGGAEHLGIVDRSGRARSASLHRRERPHVDARPPRRRASAGCRARAQGLFGSAHPAGTRRGHRCVERARGPPADAHRRIRPERRHAHRGPRGGWLRPDGPVERRLPPRCACGRLGRDRRLLRRLRAAVGAGEGRDRRLLPRRQLVVLPRARRTVTRSTGGSRPRAW